MIVASSRGEKIEKELMGLFFYCLLFISFTNMKDNQKYSLATFGAGCFWCVEAIYSSLNGVLSVKSGYSGGALKNPSYKEVCSGETGHAEVCQIIFDSKLISYKDLLDVFFKVHDPRTLNRQGNDIGTQYRSIVFYHNEGQKTMVHELKDSLGINNLFEQKVVTEICAFEMFYPAEDYHQSYFELHGEEPYCQLVVKPKVAKFKKNFFDKLKKAD